MKIRSGFVSNSSTSSFCIFGACIEKNEFIEKIRKLNPKLDAKYKSLENGEILKEKFVGSEEEFEIGEDNLDEESMEVGEKYLKKLGLSFEYGYCEDEYYYIGRYWKNINDDETGKEFKESIKESVKSLFPKAKCATFEEAWHD